MAWKPPRIGPLQQPERQVFKSLEEKLGSVDETTDATDATLAAHMADRTFRTLRGGKMRLSGQTLATGGAYQTVPVTAGGVVLPNEGTWDTTNDYWQPPSWWFDNAVTGITVQVWALGTILVGAGGGTARGMRSQLYGIPGGTSIDTEILDAKLQADLTGDYRGGGVTEWEMTGTNQAIRLQMFQNSGGNRTIDYTWGVNYMGWY